MSDAAPFYSSKVGQNVSYSKRLYAYASPALRAAAQHYEYETNFLLTTYCISATTRA
jgi:hypothetical protein